MGGVRAEVTRHTDEGTYTQGGASKERTHRIQCGRTGARGTQNDDGVARVGGKPDSASSHIAASSLLWTSARRL